MDKVPVRPTGMSVVPEWNRKESNLPTIDLCRTNWPLPLVGRSTGYRSVPEPG